ncbi:MAG TPA: GntR family transcriptional regulator [Thermoanaerobaculia bacterium]|nr:GntR family transcriptional regulator [Thermoanaerobaculia bacterium]
MFTINPTDPAPIWRQIEEGIRRLIALGALTPGAAVPSVRDLARDLRVNPNTVARAYQRLTEGGVLIVKRGEGTYVADQPAQPRKAERNEALREAAMRYASSAIAIGAEIDAAVEELESAYDRVVRNHRRRA